MTVQCIITLKGWSVDIVVSLNRSQILYNYVWYISAVIVFLRVGCAS